ncbi:hypothetical protein ACFFRR_000710 [Megaselia abdita]
MWSRWLVTILVISFYQIVFLKAGMIIPDHDRSSSSNEDNNIRMNYLRSYIANTNNLFNSYNSQRSQNYKISPKPCKISGIHGTCMFVWECIKSEGQHVGMCVDSFMFGSCCAHNLTDNIVLTETFSFTRPTKPVGWERPQSSHHTYKPSIIGMTTIERPHGAGTLVIRPSGPHHTKPSSISYKPLPALSSSTIKSKPSTVQPSLLETSNDMEFASSVSNNKFWSTTAQTTQWKISTEPNFITKPKPIMWEKPSTRPKPSKPSKKPIHHYNGTTQSSIYNDSFKKTKPTKSSVSSKPIKTTSTPLPHKISTTTTSLGPQPQTNNHLITTTQSSTKNPTTTSTLLSPVKITPSISRLNSTNDKLEVRTISAARSECGIPSIYSRPETRIVGGKNAPFGRWPWQVSVRRTSFFGFSSTHRCGGALINENWIATAGHCVDDLLTSQIRIRVGEYDFSHVQEQLPYIERGVAKKVVHPQYNFFTYEYDLALVQLDQPLEFAPHVSPICLPSTENLLIGMNATVTGWGRLSEGGTLPSVLQEVSVPIVSNDRCKSMFLRAGRQEFIPEIFLCAGFETGGQDSCQGDSGGPLQVKAANGKFFLAGIISWGIGCAEANLPGVCTRISKFVPWILEIVS